MPEAAGDPLMVVRPHCDTLNRVPPTKPAAAALCGECHRPLFSGHPVALDAARFGRHLAKSDIPLLFDFWAP
jgi:thioredoxin 2